MTAPTGRPSAAPRPRPPVRASVRQRRSRRVPWIVAGVAAVAALAFAFAAAFTDLGSALAGLAGGAGDGSHGVGPAGRAPMHASDGASGRKRARARKGADKKPLSMAEALAGVHQERVRPPEEPGSRQVWEMERQRIVDRMRAALERKDLIGVRDGLKDLEAKGMITDDVAQLRKALAGSLLVTGESAEAIEVYKRLLVADPEDHRTKLELGLSYYHEGDVDEALAWAERAASDRPTSPLYEAAVAELKASREQNPAVYERAVAAIGERYGSSSPDDVTDWQEAAAVADAIASGAGGDAQVARAYYDRAKALFGAQDPLANAAAEPLWYYVDGEILLAERRYEESIMSLVSALTSQYKGFAHVGDVYYRIGKAYAALGDTEKMRANFRMSLLNDPYSFRAREMHAALGDP